MTEQNVGETLFVHSWDISTHGLVSGYLRQARSSFDQNLWLLIQSAVYLDELVGVWVCRNFLSPTTLNLRSSLLLPEHVHPVNSPLEVVWPACQMPFQRCSQQTQWWWGLHCHLCPWLWWCQAPSLVPSASVLQQLWSGQEPATPNHILVTYFSIALSQSNSKGNKRKCCKTVTINVRVS